MNKIDSSAIARHPRINELKGGRKLPLPLSYIEDKIVQLICNHKLFDSKLFTIFEDPKEG